MSSLLRIFIGSTVVSIVYCSLSSTTNPIVLNKAGQSRCTKLKAQPYLNLQKFEGPWHEIQFLEYPKMASHRRQSFLFSNHTEKLLKCQDRFDVHGSMAQEPPSGIFQALLEDLSFDILVLATDYLNYAVVTPCYFNLPSNDEVIVIPETVMVLSRNPEAPPETIRPVKQCLLENGFTPKGLIDSSTYMPMKILMYVDKLKDEL